MHLRVQLGATHIGVDVRSNVTAISYFSAVAYIPLSVEKYTSVSFQSDSPLLCGNYMVVRRWDEDFIKLYSSLRHQFAFKSVYVALSASAINVERSVNIYFCLPILIATRAEIYHSKFCFFKAIM